MTLMTACSNRAYRGDSLETRRNIESLCCVTGTNIVLSANYTSKTNKQGHRKRNQICGYQGAGREEEELDEGSQKV